MNFSKYNTFKNWVIGILIISLIILGYFYYTKTPSYVDDNNKIIKSYTDSINVLKKSISHQDGVIVTLSEKITSINTLNDVLSSKILTLKTSTIKKVNEVKNYTKNDVDQFLSIRYKDSVTLSSSNETGKHIVTDLIIGDSSISEVVLIKEQLKNTEDKSILQSEIINEYIKEKSAYSEIINNYDRKDAIYTSSINSLTKDLKTEKRKLFLNKIGSVVIIGSLTYLLITK